jgi:hypothetical protein
MYRYTLLNLVETPTKKDAPGIARSRRVQTCYSQNPLGILKPAIV